MVFLNVRLNFFGFSNMCYKIKTNRPGLCYNANCSYCSVNHRLLNLGGK